MCICMWAIVDREDLVKELWQREEENKWGNFSGLWSHCQGKTQQKVCGFYNLNFYFFLIVKDSELVHL